jgi:EmrB/QacA subfamily drug resistance transporter
LTSRERKILLLVSGAAFLDLLDVTVVNLAFPALSRDFAGSSVSALTWVITGYAVMFAALLTAAGRLADVLGRRRVFLLGVGVFTLASLASALAPSLGALISARFVQGAGAALVLPSGLGIILAETPPERRAAAVGIWGAAAGAAAAFGPTVGGILVHLIDWRAVFYINVPIGAAIVLIGRRAIDDAAPEGGRLPDVVGTASVAAGIGLLVLGVTKASDWGWLATSTDASLGAGLALVLFSLARSRRHPAPAIEIPLWRSRPFALSNLASIFFGAAGYAAMLVSVLFLVSAWGYSVLTAGFGVSPGAVTGAVAAALAGRAVDRRGQTAVVIAGASAMCAAFVYTAFAIHHSDLYVLAFLPGNVFVGIGMGMTAVGLSSAAAMYVDQRSFAAATGLNMTARQVGGALGVAVLAAILEANLGSGITAYSDVYLFCAIASATAIAVGVALAVVTRRGAAADERTSAQQRPSVHAAPAAESATAD